MDDLAAWAIQAAAETLGYSDMSEVPLDRMDELFELAEELDN